AKCRYKAQRVWGGLPPNSLEQRVPRSISGLNRLRVFMVAKRVLVCLLVAGLALLLSACNESEAGITGPNNSPDSANPAVVAFTSASYSIAQSAGSVTISVGRTGGSNGTTKVSYSTANGSAKGGSDYTAVNGELTWSNGDLAPKTFSIPIS